MDFTWNTKNGYLEKTYWSVDVYILDPRINNDVDSLVDIFIYTFSLL